jgi:hypothetical protein
MDRQTLVNKVSKFCQCGIHEGRELCFYGDAKAGFTVPVYNSWQSDLAPRSGMALLAIGNVAFCSISACLAARGTSRMESEASE